jgi:hypothetical protein
MISHVFEDFQKTKAPYIYTHTHTILYYTILYYTILKAPVSTFVPHHFFTNNPSHPKPHCI